ncbi:SAM-dependent methyltransferase [Candidatus Syntrophocurvum alkaliphilum]|uniref:SAM-dependent methyltransferase n=1 Tax=Candidatus Syntrophocurvum alkaliphilum TaxID=2293317 RepID=A0A6I6DJS2_9FIRM|nr:class I SAM-dependent methyltransferase [Candidatus Syntrophocurvum alkaliphilum]QGU00276.1 SAM-dependent methyltransferase [Candidatus Syntrophocurvum alkaliphilum]
MVCSLCSGPTSWFYNFRNKDYYKCEKCASILLHPKFFLSLEQEKARYEEHNNCVDDLGYQRFVSPIVNAVKENFDNKAKGLDFGAGTGPVITKLLSDEGFNLALYDSFFWNNPKVLNSQYDYIVCCEVIEHFRNPLKEFKLLRSLLNPGGIIFVMTEIYSEDIDFRKWRYKNDATHVFFYHNDAFKWIKDNLDFSRLDINGRLIELER